MPGNRPSPSITSRCWSASSSAQGTSSGNPLCFAKQSGLPLDVPWAELDAEQQRVIVEGEGRFPGIRGFFNHLERKKYKLHVRVFLSRYRGYSVCSDCQGLRLRREANQVKIGGKNICEVCSMTVE